MSRGVRIRGHVLVELRDLAGLSQEDLAFACTHRECCKVTREEISAYEREDQRPTRAKLNAIIAVLKVSEKDRRKLICTPTMDALDALHAFIARISRNGDDADRRHVNKAAVAQLAAVLLPPEVVERLAAVLIRGGRVDATVVADHEEFADRLVARHRVTRPDELVREVARHADVLLGLLDRPIKAADRQRLEVIAVGSHVQAGKLAHHLGDRVAARRWFATANDIADEAGDDTLRAQALRVASVLRSPIPTGGRTGDSHKTVMLMRKVVALARQADPATRADAHRWLGLQLAADRDERGFRESFETAERLSGAHVPLDGHGFLANQVAVTPEQVSGDIGTGLVLIGRANEAVDALKASLAPGGSRRWSVIKLVDLAAARVLQGEPEQACSDLVRALKLALDTRYVTGVERIRGVRDQFRPEWADLRCVHNLDDLLRLAAYHQALSQLTDLSASL
ncbi:MAG: helix-turn-helix domain-containing protein [Egibacteraceae bacterium]